MDLFVMTSFQNGRHFLKNLRMINFKFVYICVIHHLYYTMVVLNSNSMSKNRFEVINSVKGHFKVKWPPFPKKSWYYQNNAFLYMYDTLFLLYNCSSQLQFYVENKEFFFFCLFLFCFCFFFIFWLSKDLLKNLK